MSHSENLSPRYVVCVLMLFSHRSENNEPLISERAGTSMPARSAFLDSMVKWWTWCVYVRLTYQTSLQKKCLNPQGQVGVRL